MIQEYFTFVKQKVSSNKSMVALLGSKTAKVSEHFCYMKNKERVAKGSTSSFCGFVLKGDNIKHRETVPQRTSQRQKMMLTAQLSCSLFREGDPVSSW